MQSLVGLVCEQERIQYQWYRVPGGSSVQPYRCNTLNMYSNVLGFDSIDHRQRKRKFMGGLSQFLTQSVKEREGFCWVDLCGGNGIAQSQARINLVKAEIDPKKLEIVCYDVLGERMEEIEEEQKKI